MKNLIWILLFSISLYASSVFASDVDEKSTSECLEKQASDSISAHYFSQNIDKRALDIDPTGTAILLSMAINSLYQEQLPATDIAKVIIKYTHGENRITLLQIRDSLLELKFQSFGYKNAVSFFRNSKHAHKMMAITIDEQRNITLLLSLHADFAYFMYSDGVVCKIDTHSFINKNPFILLIEDKITIP